MVQKVVLVNQMDKMFGKDHRIIDSQPRGVSLPEQLPGIILVTNSTYGYPDTTGVDYARASMPPALIERAAATRIGCGTTIPPPFSPQTARMLSCVRVGP
jgi:hypothetical protein